MKKFIVVVNIRLPDNRTMYNTKIYQIEAENSTNAAALGLRKEGIEVPTDIAEEYKWVRQMESSVKVVISIW